MITQAQIKDIYAHLQDDLSRKIFENRLLYSFTGKDEFIGNIINFSYPVEEYRQKVTSRFKDTPIVIYGAGFMGANFFCCCGGVDVVAFCDSAEGKWESEFCGRKVISPAELKKNHSNCVVVIAVLDDTAEAEITAGLVRLGFSKENIVAVNTVIDLTVSARLEYLQPEIIHPLFRDDEFFVDAGCYNFFTSLQFVKHCGGRYRKIIAFEPSPEQYSICVERAKGVCNAVVYPFGLWNETAELRFDNIGHHSGGAKISDSSEDTIKIKAVALDDILDGEAATFIKMDIEGAELNALKGAERTILKYRPKLAICVYHKPEDIWEIPAYILSLHGDYRLYLRHYSIEGGGETVLYAV